MRYDLAYWNSNKIHWKRLQELMADPVFQIAIETIKTICGPIVIPMGDEFIERCAIEHGRTAGAFQALEQFNVLAKEPVVVKKQEMEPFAHIARKHVSELMRDEEERKERAAKAGVKSLIPQPQDTPTERPQKS